MLFNSFVFLFLFLPLTVGVYFTLCRWRLVLAAKAWLVAASLYFYAYWKLSFLPIILASILVNHVFGVYLSGKLRRVTRDLKDDSSLNRRVVLAFGVVFNVALLGYFKYADFFVENVNAVLGGAIPMPGITLPLGISFFTFQQIGYLVDSYHGQTKEYDFLNYTLFVTFFPQLVAGPIVHHRDVMPQFARLKNTFLNWENIYTGLFFLALGLFKKVAVADTFAVWVNQGFADSAGLTCLTAWATSLSYTIQLYFDFSGYTDMAIGAARIMNIRIAQNFNAPYLSLDIQDFWRRWHITLGKFLRDYIYIPLGGNRKGKVRTYVNLFLTFFIGGVWHGAGWTFVIWGAMHGLALCIHRFWKELGFRFPKPLAWLVTFLFVNAAWVVFRAENFQAAVHVWSAMIDFPSLSFSTLSVSKLKKIGFWPIASFALLLVYVLEDVFVRTTQAWAAKLRPHLAWSMAAGTALAICMVLMMNQNRFSEFIYFQF